MESRGRKFKRSTGQDKGQEMAIFNITPTKLKKTDKAIMLGIASGIVVLAWLALLMLMSIVDGVMLG